MTASLTVASMDSVLKQHYLPLKVENMVYEDEPLLAWMPKYTKFGGKNLPIPLQYAPIAGRSSTFANALANVGASKFDDFVITRVHDYAIAHIDHEAMEASMGDRNAFLRATVTEINSAIRAATRSIASALPRSGTGSIGVVGSVAAGVITLATASDVVNFEVGMVLVASDAAGGDGGTLQSGTGTITNVDRDAGTLTYSGTLTGIGVGDFLYVDGDAQNGSSAAAKKLRGLDAWFPSSAPGSTAFFGVDRSVDVTRLGGVRYDASSMSIREGLISASARVQREGGKTDVFWMNPEEWVKLDKEMEGQVRYDVVKSSNGKFGFRTIALATPRGTAQVASDHNIPMGVCYGLSKRTVKLYSLGKAPKILQYGDGAGKMLRISNEDGVEVRAGYYAQFGCSAPGYNVRVTLPS